MLHSRPRVSFVDDMIRLMTIILIMQFVNKGEGCVLSADGHGLCSSQPDNHIEVFFTVVLYTCDCQRLEFLLLAIFPVWWQTMRRRSVGLCRLILSQMVTLCSNVPRQNSPREQCFGFVWVFYCFRQLQLLNFCSA